MSGTVTAFLDEARIASGEPREVRQLIEERYPGDLGTILLFDDSTGRRLDLDYWDATVSRPPLAPRGRGRPKLGVTAREVTLLPRHWEWLSRQPAGASGTLRRLVDEAEKASRAARDPRQARDAVYHFMTVTCGDRPGYEEALRALYRGDRATFEARTAAWPEDVRAYIARLADGAWEIAG